MTQLKLICNIQNQIEPQWIDRILTSTGDLRPGGETAEASRAQAAAIAQNAVYPGAQWRFYYHTHLDCEAQPFDIPGVGSYRWWFVRLDPGCVFPTHVDTFDHPQQRRLWVPCTAAQQGHVFQIAGQYVTNFAVGDVWEFADPLLPHGSANFSAVPKITLQIVCD